MTTIWKSVKYIYGMLLVVLLDLIGCHNKADKLFNYLENYCL